MADITYINKDNLLGAAQVRWRTAVGRFLLAFGSVEWFTYHMLNLLPLQPIFKSVYKLSFRQRVALVKELLESLPEMTGADFELVGRTEMLLNKAVQLLETRNLIAHNPLFMGFFDTDTGIDFDYQISKFVNLEEKLTIDALEERCLEVENLVDNLHEVHSEIEFAKHNPFT